MTSLPLAAKDRETVYKVTTRDAKGAEVKVPHVNQTALLLFVRIDQDQSRQTIKSVKKALEGLPAAHVLAVLSGKQPAEKVKKFAAELSWPVVLDPQYKMVGQFRVRVWPTSIVVLPDGRELTRLTGMPGSYVSDLNTWLAFAAKKIDRKTLRKRLSASGVVADSPHEMARRHLQVAQRLLEKGLVKQACVELDRGLNIQPKDPRLQLTKARALLLLRRPQQVMDMINRMDESSSLAGKIAVVKGGALVAMRKWDEAIQVLQVAVKLNPDPSEAYYFLGAAYQHKSMWPEATKAFRAAFEATPTGRPVALPSQVPKEPAKKEPQKKPEKKARDEPKRRPKTQPTTRPRGHTKA